MNQDGKSRKDAIYSVLFKTPKSKTMCTITLSQQIENEPRLVINSPGNIVNPALYDINIHSLTCTICLSNVCNSSFSDYINAIALCILRAGFTNGIITAAEENGDTLMYCADSDTVHFLQIKPTELEGRIEGLRAKCLDELHYIKGELQKMPGHGI